MLKSILLGALLLFVLSSATAQETHSRTLLQGRRVVVNERRIAQLKELVDEAEEGTTFVFNTDVTLPDVIVVDKENLTFTNAEDTRPVISCSPGNGAFRINANGTLIENLIIRDCEATAVDVFDEVVVTDSDAGDEDSIERIDVTIINVEFLNNIGTTAQSKGGALSLGLRAHLLVEDCIFVNNSGLIGGAITFFGQSMRIRGSTFEDNVADRSGGAIFGFIQTDDAAFRQTTSFTIENSTFLRNRVLVGSNDRTGLTVRNGIELESNPYIDFPLPASSGGALLIDNFQDVLIQDCVFDQNFAVPAGGAIYLNDNGNVQIQGSNFTNNYVLPTSTSSRNAEDLQLGGAFFIAFVDTESKALIDICRFVNNSATYGGAVHFVGPTEASFEFKQCIFEDNEATHGGGAVVFRHATGSSINRCEFNRNRAFVGGALLITNGGGVQMLKPEALFRPTIFEDNAANDGGALFIMGGGIIQIHSVIFQRNQAIRNGGALCFLDSKAGGELIIQNAQMFNNSAETGGALFLENLSKFNLIPNLESTIDGLFKDGINEFVNNKAVAGGAIYYRASNLVGNEFSAFTTSFVNNRAVRSTSDVFTTLPSIPQNPTGRRLMQAPNVGNTLLDLGGPMPCHPGGGGAICLVLSGVTNSAPIDVEIKESNFTRNRALAGGAVLVSTDAGSDWESSCDAQKDNSAAFLTNDPCRSLGLRALKFTQNQAANAGGAILASSFDHVFYSNETSDTETPVFETIDAVESTSIFIRNRVGRDGYGPNLAGTAVALNIRGDGVSDDLLVANQTSGQLHPLPAIDVNVLDGLNQIVSAGIVDTSLRVRVDAKLNAAASIASGQVVATASNGVATFDALTLSAPAGRYEIVFSVRGELVESARANVTIRECALGERYNEDGFVCVSCTFETFTIYTQVARCEDCPDNARCAGNATWIPTNNYWHSSPFSVIMHECFHNDACSYDERVRTLERQHTDRLEEFLARFDAEGTPVFTNEEYTQCSVGYEGPLCGSCSNGFGHADGKTCVECSSRSATAKVIFFLAVWQLVLLAVTIRSALVSIRDMNQMMAVAQQQAALASVQTRRNTQTSTQSSSFIMDQDSVMSRRTAGMPGDATNSELENQYGSMRVSAPMVSVMPQPTTQLSPKQQYSAQFIVAAQHVSETIKIFVNFFQVTSVAVNINLEWSSSIKNMLSGMNSVAGFSNGAAFTPMTCLLNSSADHRSIYGVVLRIAFPLCLMVLVMAFFFVRWRFMRRSPHVTRFVSNQFIRSRSIICFLVAGFYAYQSISEDLMATVSCIKLDKGDMSDARSYDDPSLGVDYSQFSIAQKRYWTEDTNIECFSREHAYLVGFLGIPGIILFLCGVPLYLLFFLLYKRHRNELMHINVLNTYGFIYQNYEDKFVYWEVMILIRKALIGAIVVFAYPLGANLQGVMALGVLILGLAIHLIATPFKYLPLNILEGCSLVVSIFTIYSGVVFNDENTSENAEVLLSVLLVIVNSLLGLVFIFTVFVYGDKYVVAKLKYLDATFIPGNAISRMLLLASMLSEQMRRTVTLHINRTVRGRNRGGQKQHPIQMASMPAGSGPGRTPSLQRQPTPSDVDAPHQSDAESQL